MDRRIKATPATSPAVAYASIFILAMLLVLPAAIWPRAHDSFWIDWVWADQFTSELQRGVPYPRWLPSSHGGLGSPVFYYYPPLAFYVSGLLGLAGLSTYASVIGAFALGLAASGAAMYLWLKEWTRLPLHGALFYMAAPYHLYDIYGRGALAETMAIAFIPLVALGIRRVSKDQGILVLALAYAGLVTTHLPLALLTSLLFVVPYGMLIVRKQPKTLWSLGLALASGIGLSAIYLLPALALEPFRDVAALYPMPGYRPENWSLAFPGAGAVNLVRGLITAIVVTLLVPTLYLIIKERSGWAAYAAICCLVMSGLVPLIWRLPLLDSVQFPYRMLPLAEFGIGTALALAPSSSRLLALAAFPPLALSVFFVTAPADNKAPESLARFEPHIPTSRNIFHRGAGHILCPRNGHWAFPRCTKVPSGWERQRSCRLSTSHHGRFAVRAGRCRVSPIAKRSCFHTAARIAPPVCGGQQPKERGR